MKKIFAVYDATPYLNKPWMMTTRMNPIKVVYETALWAPSEDKLTFPQQSRIDNVINGLLVSNYKGPVILDIEIWPVYTQASYRQWLLQIMTMFKTADPSWQIGHYAIAPRRNTSASLLDNTSAPYQSWQAENDAVAEIAAQCDVLCPSIYTVVPDQVRWESYAVQNILEAQRYWPRKPVIPFLWPQYHNTLQGYSLKYIDDQFWMHQLMTVWRMCDGLIIWKNWTNPLEEFTWQLPWAIPTEQFLEKYTL